MTPRCEEALRRYTARRLSCEETGIPYGQTVVVTAREVEAQFFVSSAFFARNVVNLCVLDDATVTQVNRDPTSTVQRAVGSLDCSRRIGADEFASRFAPVIERRGAAEPYLYLLPECFQPVATAGVRELGDDDADALGQLRSLLSPREAEYVGSNQAVVFGAYVGETLVAAASHYVFEEDGVASAGVITHPDYRRQGSGKAVTAAAAQWALDRGWIVEWSTTAQNRGSLGIAAALGFRQYCVETEFVMRDE
jgi:GNAT superfamily N-acetyltransferase